MSKRTAFIPQAIAPLEARVVPSALGRLPVHVHRHQRATPTAQTINLQGTVQGLQTPLSGQQGTYALNGAGTVAPLGAAKAAGTLSIRGGEPTVYSGKLTLTTADGSVAVQIYGLQFGPTYLGRPIRLHYTVVGGTGAYQGTTGQGNVAYSTMPRPLANPVAGQSLFRLTFGTSATAV